MRVVLRILAIAVGFGAGLTLLLVLRFWRLSGFGDLLATGAFGSITVLGWVLNLIVGPFAAIQLWRLRDSGRRASLVLVGYSLLYYAVGWFFFRQPQTRSSEVWWPGVYNALLAALLFSRSARRACHRPE